MHCMQFSIRLRQSKVQSSCAHVFTTHLPVVRVDITSHVAFLAGTTSRTLTTVLQLAHTVVTLMLVGLLINPKNGDPFKNNKQLR